ncbi:MAG: hypothetical protein ACREUA_01130, partial [Burkholderiales bacterium]
YSSYHKHSAYILEYADMPGFSKLEQKRLGLLSLAHRATLRKLQGQAGHAEDRRLILALRLAALFYRGRVDVKLPRIKLSASEDGAQLAIERDWLACNPLTEFALRNEVKEWKLLDMRLELTSLNSKANAAAVAAEVRAQA